MSQLAAPEPTAELLAVEDQAFLLSDEMRPLRFAMEYAKPEIALRRWGVRSTVVVFGSARIPAPADAAAAIAAAPEARRARVEALARLAPWYEAAREFARIVSLRGGALAEGKPRDNVIATGGGPGIMEAANRGAADVGAPSIGFAISLPHEEGSNRFSTPALRFRFHYFAMRKMHLAMRARALAVFPGGFGTLDELFEILTLQQTGKAPPVGVVLFGRDWWSRAIGWDALAAHGMVDAADLDLFRIVEEPEEAWEWLVGRGLTGPDPAWAAEGSDR